MLLYPAIAICTILMAWQTRPEAYPHTRQRAINLSALSVIFLALFFVGATRIRTGNDYWWYTNIMHEASVHGHVPTEEGFNLIVRIVYRAFGYENYVFVFAVMTFLTVTLFLVGMWRLSEDFAMTFAMFILLGYYFQSFSTVRYYVALAAALCALYYADKGDWVRFVLIVLAASLIHKSILVTLVLYPLARLKWRPWVIAVAGVLSGVMFFCSDLVLRVALYLYPTYQNAEDAGDSGFSLMNVARCVLTLLFVFWNARTYLADEEEQGIAVRRLRMYTNLSIMGLFLYIGGAKLPQISRIAFYLTLPQILLLPAVAKRVEDKRIRRIMQGLLLIACVLYFVRYLVHASDEGILVLPYHSILFYGG